MDLSFIILTWNSANFIESCLDSVLRSLSSSEFEAEIFVVDNGSVDATRTILQAQEAANPGLVKPILLSENHGTTYSRNLGLKKSVGKYIVVMDSDVEVFDDTIKVLVSVLEGDTSIGLVAPKLIYPDGQIQKSTDEFPTVISKVRRFFFLRAIEKNMSEYTTPTQVDYAISAMWVLRRELLDRIGFLDENIFYAPEDADYCLSCWRHGYKVVYYPQAVAVHRTQELSRGLALNRAKIEHLRGLLYYFRKHRYLFSAPSVRVGLS